MNQAMSVKASLPKGTRDFLPRSVRQRAYVIDIIKRVYEAHGFEPLETPAIENIETLTGKYGEEGDQLLFKILKRGAKAATGECDLGLRYDLTVPLSRVVAMHFNDLPRVFKRYQIQPVWRADRPAKGRFREFYQCDIDVIGATSNLVEIDLLTAVAEVFDRLGFSDTTIRINDRRILRGLIAVSGIPPELEVDAITAIDKIDKIGPDGVRKEFNNRGVDADAGEALLNTLQRLQGTNTDLLNDMRSLFAEREDAHDAVEGLQTILDGLLASDVAAERIRIDPALARGLGYYTGPIYEVNSPGLAGSLGGGGRYDNLIGMFLGRDIPACGVSLGLERILVIMDERNMFPTRTHRLDVMVANFSSTTHLQTLALATTLRRAGLSVDLYPKKDKPAKQFKYANRRNIPFVTLIGRDEGRDGIVAVKNMTSGEQVTLPPSEVAAPLPKHLAE